MWWASTEDWTLIERTTLRKNIGWSIQEFCFFLNFNYCTNHFKAKIEWVPNLLLFSQSNINSIVYLRWREKPLTVASFPFKPFNLLVKSQWWRWGGGGEGWWYCIIAIMAILIFAYCIFLVATFLPFLQGHQPHHYSLLYTPSSSSTSWWPAGTWKTSSSQWSTCRGRGPWAGGPTNPN